MVFDHYAMPGRKMNRRIAAGRIYEKGIYDILSDLRENYGNPRCFISENGMGVEDEQRFARDGRIEDDYRIEFVRDHLIWLHRARYRKVRAARGIICGPLLITGRGATPIKPLRFCAARS